LKIVVDKHGTEFYDSVIAANKRENKMIRQVFATHRVIIILANAYMEYIHCGDRSELIRTVDYRFVCLQ